MEPDDPLIAREDAYHQRVRTALGDMRSRTEGTIERGVEAATAVDGEIVEWHLRRRLATLDDDPRGLFFGHIGGDDDDWYVGRRHIESALVDGETLVVDWRAPVAVPFYRATVADPFGLDTRRRHTIEDHRVVAVFDEVFDDPDTVSGGGVPDPLLAELERSRSGEMRDIVATIQIEQDEIIRSPLDRLVVVQGGPGTGKTAVGLHRAAFLLYDHRERLESERVLVVGPNKLFLRYIAQVLPSLGESAVVQLTVDGVAAPRLRVEATEDDRVAELKGDARLADVAARLVDLAIAPAEVDVPLGVRRVRVPADDVARLLKETLGRETPRNKARTGFLTQLARLALPDADETDRARLRGSAEWKKATDRLWPSQSAAALLRDLYGNQRVRADACRGLLADDESELLARRPARKAADEPWTRADVVLMDEVDDRLNGTAVTFGHVVVDEAQDLSALALRMIARRSPGRSMTVLGDLAQATAPGCQTDWNEALRHLGDGEIQELRLGYRLPAPIVDLASRLLPAAAPHVAPSRSVRVEGADPEIVPVDGPLPDAVVAATTELAGLFGTVGVIAPVGDGADLVGALQDAGLAVGHGLTGLTQPVTVVDAVTAKGLEFDAVVVAEPAAIVAERLHGLRALYVALTRAVQVLRIVHTEPLPAALVD